jgi:hypothetical protein
MYRYSPASSCQGSPTCDRPWLDHRQVTCGCAGVPPSPLPSRPRDGHQRQQEPSCRSHRRRRPGRPRARTARRRRGAWRPGCRPKPPPAPARARRTTRATPDIATGGKVRCMPPCLFCMDNRTWDTQGRMRVASAPAAGLVSRQHVEAGVGLQLAEAHRAEVHDGGVALLEAVVAVLPGQETTVFDG